MSKSKEELNKIKEEVEAVNEKLAELTPEEIAQVNGGVVHGVDYRGARQCARRPCALPARRCVRHRLFEGPLIE